MASYLGSFDPTAKGALDLIARGSRIFDELVVAILSNQEKTAMLSVEERKEMIELLTSGYKNVRVDTFEGLTVDYATRVRATAVLRGIRAISDYEYELQMALMNRKLQPSLETVFMMPAEHYSYLSSRLGPASAAQGGPVGALVPGLIEQRLRAKFGAAKRSKAPAASSKRGRKRNLQS